jgi:hypothetical protein
MELFKNIRLGIGAIILKEKAAKSRRRMVYKNFSLVKNIGIVWNAANKDEFHALSKFHQEMSKYNIDVHVIGYYAQKKLPDTFTAIRYFSCIRKHEINLLYMPESRDAKNFINKQFDVLIDINFDKIFTLRYITILSNALFKVGLSEPENYSAPFDLMMEIKKPVSVEDYLKQIVQYLEMMNS